MRGYVCPLSPASLSLVAHKKNASIKKMPKKGLHVAYMGSDAFSVRVLDALRARNAAATVPAVASWTTVVPPAKPRGRGMAVSDGPLADYARLHALPSVVAPPRSLRGWKPAICDSSHHQQTVDTAVVVSFPYFVPRALLATFPRAAINLHPSLLPKYRGAAPIQHALWNADRVTGVSVIELDPTRFDAGRILAQETLTIPEPDTCTYHELAPKLADLGSEMLFNVLANLEECKRLAASQDENAVTLAPKISKQDGCIDCATMSATQVWNRFRAFGHQQEPLKTSFRGTSVQLTALAPPAIVARNATEPIAPGMVTHMVSKSAQTPTGALYVQCFDGSEAVVLQVKPAGKRAMDVAAWINGVGGSAAIKRGQVRFDNAT
ncbi:formyl transferase [Blastocladiella britannica]|nr:formyl transferase [Blastocladiella britannica]